MRKIPKVHIVFIFRVMHFVRKFDIKDTYGIANILAFDYVIMWFKIFLNFHEIMSQCFEKN